MKRTGLFQYARIEWDRLVLDDYEDFFLHLKSLRLTTIGRVQRGHKASSPAPSVVWEFCWSTTANIDGSKNSPYGLACVRLSIVRLLSLTAGFLDRGRGRKRGYRSPGNSTGCQEVRSYSRSISAFRLGERKSSSSTDTRSSTA